MLGEMEPLMEDRDEEVQAVTLLPLVALKNHGP